MKPNECKIKPRKHSACKFLEKNKKQHAWRSLAQQLTTTFDQKEHFLLSTMSQYWTVYLLKDLLQVKGKLGHLLALTQVWTGKQ